MPYECPDVINTAGRHKQEEDLIAEMDELDNIINPTEAILVIDGTIGQQAGEQARAFSQATDIGSIIITKLDGSAKGGGAMSVKLFLVDTLGTRY